MFSLGSIPVSWFSVLGWRWMCQYSRRHHVVTKGWLSMTSALDRSTWWPVDMPKQTRSHHRHSGFFKIHGGLVRFYTRTTCKMHQRCLLLISPILVNSWHSMVRGDLVCHSDVNIMGCGSQELQCWTLWPVLLYCCCTIHCWLHICHVNWGVLCTCVWPNQPYL